MAGKQKRIAEKEFQFQGLLFGHHVVWSQITMVLGYVVPRREAERQFGFRFQGEAKPGLEASPSDLSLSYRVLLQYPYTVPHHLLP